MPIICFTSKATFSHQADIIEQLLWCRKPIVSGMYQIFDGSWRNPCIRNQDKKPPQYQ
jgi:hypothetical protein